MTDSLCRTGKDVNMSGLVIGHAVWAFTDATTQLSGLTRHAEMVR